MVQLLKEQLAKLALDFVSVPEHYELQVEDYSNNQATFIWATSNLEDGIDITLDQNGSLLTLSKPSSKIGTVLTIEQQKSVAELFLTEQYKHALEYLTLSETIQKEDETRFIYEQYVGGYPLTSFYTKIVVSKYGEVIDFKYDGYTKTPPIFPDPLVDKNTILQHLHQAKWSLSLHYLNNDLYSVSESGLYQIYESSIVYQSFDATTGAARFDNEEEERVSLLPFPKVATLEKQATIEDIIGIPDSMEKLREIELDDNKLAIVWRDKDWQAPKDKTMDSFFHERLEDTVKAKIDTRTNTLIEFIWFKKRTGSLQLSFEACRDIACTFITTYFTEYLPFLQLKLTEAEFNVVHRAFFTFPLHNGNGQIIDGKQFYVAVNRTTGYIDLIRSPRIDLSIVQAYEPLLIQPLETVISALDDINVFLTWSKRHEEEEIKYVLQYQLGQAQSKQTILGIDAVSGTLVLSKL